MRIELRDQVAAFTSYDQKILIFVQSLRLKILNQLFLILTYSGTGKTWLALAILLNALNKAGILFAENQAHVLRALFCPLLAWVFGSVIKKIVSRDRPSEKIEGFQRIIQSPTCGSFPSSHSASATAFFIGLQFISHPWAPIVGVWAFLVSFSRLYLGVHYLSDIIGGVLLGTLAAAIVICLGYI